MCTISLQEAKEIIHWHKNDKTLGKNGMCAERIKSEERETPRLLQHFLPVDWDKEDMPEDRTKGVIVKLPKR